MPQEINVTECKSDETEQEAKLLKKIEELEQLRAQDAEKLAKLENELKAVAEENNNLKNDKQKLELELSELRKNPADSTEVQIMKEQSEELLTKAKGIIFEKTKVVKNQELQIEALNQQVTSLKEVVSITKDLLDIRNLELKHLTDKLDVMEQKIAVERDRHEIMQKKMERMLEMNGDLKREYETQLVLFSALRERYNERELAKGVVEDLRADMANGDSADANP